MWWVAEYRMDLLAFSMAIKQVYRLFLHRKENPLLIGKWHFSTLFYRHGTHGWPVASPLLDALNSSTSSYLPRRDRKKAACGWSSAMRKYLPFCLTRMFSSLLQHKWRPRRRNNNEEIDNLQMACKNLKIAPSDNNINYFHLSLTLCGNGWSMMIIINCAKWFLSHSLASSFSRCLCLWLLSALVAIRVGCEDYNCNDPVAAVLLVAVVVFVVSCHLIQPRWRPANGVVKSAWSDPN